MAEKVQREEWVGESSHPDEDPPASTRHAADERMEATKEVSESSMTIEVQVEGQRQKAPMESGGYGVTASLGPNAGGSEERLTPERCPAPSIEQYLRSYLSFADDRYFLPLALFAMLQHCWDQCFDEVPYLSVSAAVKGAGKTRVLELLNFLAGEDNAVLVEGSITVAALYTEMAEKKVLLVDESEKLQDPHSPFRPILNTGYRRGQFVIRKIGAENRRFSTFSPKVFAQIGDVYDSLRDRCIAIEMQRKTSGNRKEYVQQTAREEGAKIACEIAEAIGERIGEIRTAYLNYHTLYPSLDFLRARDKEIWKPIFTLCQIFVPQRIPELERSAIDIATMKTLPVRRFEQLRQEEEKTQKLEYAEQLLRDSLSVIGERDRIPSGELVQALRRIPTSPWRSYEGIGITEISLAAMLRLFAVEPRTIRVKPKGQPNSTAKGYLRAHLTAAARAAQSETDGSAAWAHAGDKGPWIEIGIDAESTDHATQIF